MGFAFQALIAFAGLAFSVFVAVGLADNRPVPAPAESPAAVVEPLESMFAAAEPDTLVAEAEFPPEEGRAEPQVTRPVAVRANPPVVRRVYRVTAYCIRGTTASGVEVRVGQCAAPPDIPFGSRIYVPALRRTLIVTDRTAEQFRHNTVDVFIPRYKACRVFGRRDLECEITLPRTSNAERG